MMKHQSTGRLFDLQLVTLSHTPGTENGATALQERFRQEFANLQSIIKFTSNAFATETEDYEVEEDDPNDGVMRFVH